MGRKFLTGMAALSVAISLTACSALKTVYDGFRQARATETALASETGVRPSVGFDWSNGVLTQVRVQFPGFVKAHPAEDLAAATRKAVRDNFSQPPRSLMLQFEIGQGG